MPKIDIASLRVRRNLFYPEPFTEPVKGRSWQRLAAAGGLTQFGVNLMRLEPGAWASQRHWHEAEDEFILVTEGELVLVEDEGKTVLRKGDMCAFKAGVPNGHHLVNRSERDGVFLVIGTDAAKDRAHYPDIDLVYERENGVNRFTKRSGEAW